MKKVGKTIRPFRFNLNQAPYDYTVKATNRLKGLDLIECLKDYGQICDIVHTEDRNQDYPQEKEMQKGKIVVWGSIQITEKRREVKAKKKRKDIPIWMWNSKEKEGEIRKTSSGVNEKK